MRDVMREGANLLVAGAVAIVCVGAFIALSMWGLLKYTEERWGVSGVENLVDSFKWAGGAVLVLVVVVVVWRLVDGSYRAGGKVATDSMVQAIDGLGVAVEFFTASQKAQAEAVKVQRIAAEADATRAKADTQMDLREWEWELEQKKLEARQQFQLEAQNQKLNMRQHAALEDRQRRQAEQDAEERRIRQLPWNQTAAAPSGYDGDEDEEAAERAPRFRRLH